MRAIIRPARADELQAAEELVARSINDLTERHGFGRIATVRPAEFQLFSLRDDPDGLWVAEADGELAGFAFSWAMRRSLVSRRAVRVARPSGKRHRRRADAADLRACAEIRRRQPRADHLRVQHRVARALHQARPVSPRAALSLSRWPARRAVTVRNCDTPTSTLETDREKLAQLDLQCLGRLAREAPPLPAKPKRGQGRSVSLRSGLRRLCLRQRQRSDRSARVARQDMMGPAFRTALALAAATGAPQISAFVPGTATEAIGAAVAQGMRITLPMVLLSARDFGDWTRYLPRNPGFM